jgi:hypothetical protein
MVESPSINDLIRPFHPDEIARYVQIRPDGIHLANGSICPELEAQVLSFSAARTRYEKHQSVCRSLDGIQTINADRKCSPCPLRKDCTAQIRLDLIHCSGVLRFLLSQRSLRNFMLFSSTVRQRKIPLTRATITIKVLNRGRWGELRFFLKP